ncbi:hypothetical protein PSHT_03573 [Puccinia striiformis]|uniref:Uncharacterized protein n=1 Tax=Puccinia striiformis TaxID=27350 RepID=A0A2S4WF32_9BASI|nr:hypothetical protein PSHT_03573 [Puccinia striiformis]
MPAQKKKNSTATSAALETQTNPPTSTPASKKERSIAWEKDAVNPGFPSMQILLDWIQAPGNFIQWQGKKGIVLEFCLGPSLFPLLIFKFTCHKNFFLFLSIMFLLVKSHLSHIFVSSLFSFT